MNLEIFTFRGEERDRTFLEFAVAILPNQTLDSLYNRYLVKTNKKNSVEITPCDRNDIFSISTPDGATHSQTHILQGVKKGETEFNLSGIHYIVTYPI